MGYQRRVHGSTIAAALAVNSSQAQKSKGKKCIVRHHLIP